MDRLLLVEAPIPGRLPLGSFELDLERGELVGAHGQPADLRKQALDVLLVLGENAGHVVTKDELMRRVWPDVVVTEDSLVQAITDIRRVLDDREHKLVRTITRRGYMLTLPPSGGAVETPRTADGSTTEPPPAGRRFAWALLALALLGASAVWFAYDRLRGPEPTHDPPQIAVLAFHERGNTADGNWLGPGLSQDLVMELGRNQGLNVVAHHSSFALSNKGLPVAELGRQLHAQYLIDGVVERNGERLSLEAELIDVRADKVLWVSRHETEGGQVVQARDEIVRKVAGTLLSKMRETEKQRAARAPPKSLDVYALTQKGLALKHRFTPEATREARAGLERALAADPQYGPAWWVLGWLNAADAHLGLTEEWNQARMPEAIAQINRGIEFDPYSSSAYQALAVAYLTPGHDEDALAAAQRAVELGPGDAEAWLFYALALLPTRPPALALASAQRAMEMNPIPPVYYHAHYGQVLWANGQPDAALREAEECLRKAPLHDACQVVRLVALAQTGHMEEARTEAAKLRARNVDSTRICHIWGGSAEVAGRCRKLVVAAGVPE